MFVSRRSDRSWKENKMSKSRFLAVFAAVMTLTAALSAAEPNVIQRENALPGSNDWQLTRVKLDNPNQGRTSLIEGYCSKQSVAAGEKIDIMVSTNP